MKTSPKSKEMLRSVLDTGLLVTVYRAALTVAVPGVETEKTSSQHKIYRAESKKINSKKFQNVKFFQNFN